MNETVGLEESMLARWKLDGNERVWGAVCSEQGRSGEFLDTDTTSADSFRLEIGRDLVKGFL